MAGLPVGHRGVTITVLVVPASHVPFRAGSRCGKHQTEGKMDPGELGWFLQEESMRVHYTTLGAAVAATLAFGCTTPESGFSPIEAGFVERAGATGRGRAQRS